MLCSGYTYQTAVSIIQPKESRGSEDTEVTEAIHTSRVPKGKKAGMCHSFKMRFHGRGYGEIKYWNQMNHEVSENL